MPIILKRLKYGRAIEGAKPEIKVTTINPGISVRENRTPVACLGVARKFNECSTNRSIPGFVPRVFDGSAL
jgi:hypothetical protein